MRIYVYKILVLFVAIFFLYQFTIGHTIYKIQNKFYSSMNKNSIEEFKEKIRDEINSSLKKDKILNKEDAIMLNELFIKLSSEIKNSEINYSL